MRACARVGCVRAGVALPELQVPATGYAFEAHAPVSVTLDLPLCAVHMAELRADVQSLLTADLRTLLSRALAGRAPPDFERARVLARRIDAPELAGFLGRARGH